jgi:Domain of Unknown Function with PDB structure (DUF3857)/Transglutaminase-like superfamily
MRIRCLLRFAILLIITALPTLVSAQFQPPSADELKMTADPQAPGADAVILDYEETDNDIRDYQNYYTRIKVLTERGKDAATIELPYWKGAYSVAEIEGRTIHPDGTVIPLTGKPEDMLSEKVGEFSLKRKVFTMPSVEVGSVLEFSYQLRINPEAVWSSGEEWRVQQQYFVHRAHYEFTPYGVANVAWWPHLPPNASVRSEASGDFSLDITDVPPTPVEEWMPPINSVLYRVLFYYTGRPIDASDFWITITKEWSKDVDKYAEPTKIIHAAVDGLVSPSDSELDKAKKLYAAVQALDNTDYSRTKSESERRELHLKDIKRAEDTWNQKSGTSSEIAYLYLAMLRAAGFKAYAMQTVDRKYEVFDPAYFSFNQLNIALVVLSTGGKELLLDPGEKMCPFGMLSWRHSETRGVRQANDGISLMTTPPQAFADNMTTYNANITLDEHGAMTGSFTIVMSGQTAMGWRQMAVENDVAEVKKQFDRQLETIVPDGVAAHVDRFMGMDNTDGSLIAMVKASGTLGVATGKRLLLPGYFFETRGNVPFVNQEKRLEPVDMEYAERVNDNVTYNLPAGFTVEGAPPDTKIAWPAHAILVTRSVTDPGEIVVAHSIVRAFALAKPEEYQDLRGFYQKVAAANQAELVLKSTGTGKGY